MEQKEQDRLTLVEIHVAKLDTKLEIIANNHLKHIQDDVTNLKKTQWWTFSTLVGVLISVVVLLVQAII
jgi:predicted neutral ceramidase superfamily lipid hydrolase